MVKALNCSPVNGTGSSKSISTTPLLKRWRTSSTLPASTTREDLKRAHSSHTSSTDCILCVEKITVQPLSLKAKISLFRSSAFTGSKPLKGSSKISNSGSCITVQTNCIFLLHPFAQFLDFTIPPGHYLKLLKPFGKTLVCRTLVYPFKSCQINGLFAHFHFSVQPSLLR